MKFILRKSFLIMIASMVISSPVYAQSSVTLYGVLDTGVAYLNNSGGRSKIAAYSSQHEPSFFGIRGVEDLGGGSTAFFTYTQGVNLTTGVSSAKESYVGLSSPTFGKLTLGRQYDLVLPFVAVNSLRGNSVAATHPGDYDRSAGIYLNNALKYTTPNFHGFEGNLMYSFGSNATGATNAGASQGANLVFNAKDLRIVAVYENVRGVTATPYTDLGVSSIFDTHVGTTTPSMLINETVRALGGFYDINKLRLFSSYSNTRLQSGLTGVTNNLWTVDAGVWDSVTPALRLGGGVAYSKLDANHWNTYQLFADYFLSARTDIYLRAIMQTVGSGNRAVLFSQTPSSSTKQWLIGPGIMTRF